MKDAAPRDGWARAWAALGRTLTFRLRRSDIERFDWRCLLLGMLLVWLVGAGRSWDALEAGLFDRLGLASLIYAPCLAGLLWAVARPIASRPPNYFQTLTFVAMTAPPAIVYAIPFQLWTATERAVELNAWALAFVAAYRVAMLVVFYRRATELSWLATGVLTVVPLNLIAVVLALLRVPAVVARSMAGIRDEPTAAEQMDAIIAGIGILSFFAIPVVLLVYLFLFFGRAWSASRNPADAEEGG